MTVSIKNYNHNAKNFMDGSNAVGDTYKVMLLSSSAAHDATHTTVDEVSNTGAYEVSGNGWTAGGEALSNVTVTTVNTEDAKWDADDLSILITGGTLTFRNYLILNATDGTPMAFIERDSDIVFAEDAYGSLTWPTDGIAVLSYVAPA